MPDASISDTANGTPSIHNRTHLMTHLLFRLVGAASVLQPLKSTSRARGTGTLQADVSGYAGGIRRHRRLAELHLDAMKAAVAQ